MPSGCFSPSPSHQAFENEIPSDFTAPPPLSFEGIDVKINSAPPRETFSGPELSAALRESSLPFAFISRVKKTSAPPRETSRPTQDD